MPGNVIEITTIGSNRWRIGQAARMDETFRKLEDGI